MDIKDQKHIRRIFYNVSYDDYEIEAIKSLKRTLRSNSINHNYDDAQLLKFCYSGDFNTEKILEKIKTYTEWMNDPKIQNPDFTALSILE